MRVPLLLLAALLLARCNRRDGAAGRPLPYYRSEGLVPTWIGERDPAWRTLPRVGSFVALDQRGRLHTERLLDGHISVVGFFSAACRAPCAAARGVLRRLQAASPAAPEVQIVLFTTRPAEDTGAVLARFARAEGLDADRWRLLRTDSAYLRHLARTSFFLPLPDTLPLRPDGTLYLVDGRRHLRGVYDGTLGYDATRLLDDVATLRRQRR